jgi:ATP-dependent exoDNAse (exonuclease V) beta subunit
LEQWIAWQRSLPLKEVIWKVVLSSPLGLKLIDETGDNSSVWLNINRFIEELPDAPLGDIVEMLEENEKENVDKTVGESSSEVVIMTVHKSKGLKFQHVITVIPRPAGKNKQGFRWAQLSVKGKNRYLTVPSLTLTDDPSAGDRNKSELKTVVDYQSGLEETEEEKRLFYVALTRAVQGVTIYNSGNKNTLPEGGSPDRNLHVSKTVSQLFNRIENMGKEAEREAGISHNGFFVFEKLEPDKKDAGNVSQYSDPVKEKLFFPLLRENNRFIIKLNPSRISEFFSEEKNSGRGKFSRGDYDPVDLGTSFHEFMEQNIRSLLAGEKNFSEDIPDEIALHVANTVELLSPFSSSASVYPEAYFSAAEEIKVKDKNVRVEIEGIADLILKTHDGDWLLFDYKTGRFNPGKYFLQLAVYRYMFNKILGVFPRKTGIIFTNPSGHSPEIYFLDELTDFISIDVIGVFHRIAENYFS